MSNKLTGKQIAFTDAYEDHGSKITFRNGLESAKFARYKGNNATLRAIASENLTKPNIIAEIDEIRAKRAEEAGYNREQSLKELNTAQQRAIEKGDISSEIAAIREKNTIFALRTENINTTGQQQGRELTDTERQSLRLIADKVAEEVVVANRAKVRRVGA